MNIKNRISVFLMGGLGNQLFQLARAYSLKEMGYDVCVVRLTRFKTIIYKLIGFTQHEDWLDIENITKTLNIPIKEVNFYQIVFLALIFLIKKFKVNIFFDTVLNQNKTIQFKFVDVGYFQSEKHISKNSIDVIASSIINSLEIHHSDEIKSFIAHIRGGDFLYKHRTESQVLPINRNEAYELLKLASHIKTNIQIVTNDKDFVSEIFNFSKDIVIRESKSAKDDFLTLCRSNILFLSNSTFSFWAGVISIKLNKAQVYTSQSYPFKNLLNTSVIKLG